MNDDALFVLLGVSVATTVAMTFGYPAYRNWRIMRAVPGRWPRRCLLGMHSWRDVPAPPIYGVKNGRRIVNPPYMPTQRCRRCGWTVEDWIAVHRMAPPKVDAP